MLDEHALSAGDRGDRDQRRRPQRQADAEHFEGAALGGGFVMQRVVGNDGRRAVFRAAVPAAGERVGSHPRKRPADCGGGGDHGRESDPEHGQSQKRGHGDGNERGMRERSFRHPDDGLHNDREDGGCQAGEQGTDGGGFAVGDVNRRQPQQRDDAGNDE